MVSRIVQVTRQVVVEDRHVTSALNIRLAGKSIYATSRFADISEQQLQDGEGADALHASCMLRHPQGIEDRAGAVLGQSFGDLLNLGRRNSEDALSTSSVYRPKKFRSRVKM